MWITTCLWLKNGIQDAKQKRWILTIHIIIGLPRELYTKEFAVKVAGNFKNVLSIQLKEKSENGERFFRIRASVNVKSPIRRVVRIKREDQSESLAIIRYERLSLFCYGCRVMGHNAKNCKENNDSRDKRYGFWLMTDYIPSKCI